MKNILALLTILLSVTATSQVKDTTRKVVGKDTIIIIGTTIQKSVTMSVLVPYTYPERTVDVVVKPYQALPTEPITPPTQPPVDSTYDDYNPFRPEGYGSQVTGGTGYPVRYVTALTESALKTAIGAGNCTVKFSVSGTIIARLNYTSLKNVTIDGEGKVTIDNNGQGDLFSFEGSGCSNIIIRGLKLRNAGNDIIGIRCQRVFVSNCSFDKSGDGLCDITEGAQFVTIQYCLFGDSENGSILLAYNGTKNITITKNLFTDRDRAPLAHNASGTWPNNKSNPISYLMAEVVNNGMTNYSDRASIASYGGTLQIKNNWYYNENGIKINADNRSQDSGSTIFCSGNVTASGKAIGISNHAEWPVLSEYQVTLIPAKDIPAFLKTKVGSGNNDARDKALLALFPAN